MNDRTDPENAAFVAANTAPGSHPLVPEIRLRLATEMMPIWGASEAQLDSEGVEPPFWAFVWPGGAALARYLLDHPESVRGKDVFDVAAGSGIAAIAAARAGAAHVRAADIDPLARAAIKTNAALNDVAISVTEGDPLAAPPPASGVILAGDVFYDREMAAKMGPWLRKARTRGTQVLVADPGRSYLPKHELAPMARFQVPTTLDLEDREFMETVIYRLDAGPVSRI